METRPRASTRAERLDAAFAQEEHSGLRLAARIRVAVLAVIAVWISFENPFPEVLYFYGYVVLFAVLGFGPLLLRRAGVSPALGRYLFPLLDVALLTVAVIVPNPLEQQPSFPLPMVLRHSNELYLFVFISAAAFTYSPRAVLWAGFCAAFVWSLATIWVLMQPGSLGSIPPSIWHQMSTPERMQAALDPHRVYVGVWGRQVVLFLVTAAALAAFVRRARRLVQRQAETERERANLSRYFSPNMVDELAQSDQPLGPTRQQDVAVLFADIVGFTGMAETLPPAAVIELLRAYHGRMERLVFDHGGTVDKYIGDGLMATFGTPRAGAADATNALRCARAMTESMRAWNGERERSGEPPLRIGIGLHVGPVVLGDIGGEARLEYAVIGDTVNVASRLERLTRAQGASIVASDALVAAVRREAATDLAALLADFAAGPPQALRGRAAPMPIWQLGDKSS